MDLRQMGTIYYRVVGTNGKVIGDGHVLEKDLSYAFQCPVVVTSETGDDKLEGVVLQAKVVEGSMVYTVMHGVDGGFTSYKEGIKAERVRYRMENGDGEDGKVETDQKVPVARGDPVGNDAGDNAIDEPPSAEVTTCGSVRSVDGGNDRDKSNPGSVSQSVASMAEQRSVQSDGEEPGQVLEGATRGYNNLEPTPETKSHTNARPSPSIESMTSPSMEEGSTKRPKLSLGDASEKDRSFEINLPMWLQKDKESRDKLYGELLPCYSINSLLHSFLSPTHFNIVKFSCNLSLKYTFSSSLRPVR